MAGLFVTGCGGDSTAPKATAGTFSGTLSGDITGSRSGTAEFSEADGFGISMTGGTASNPFALQISMEDRPGTGTYEYENFDFEAEMLLGDSEFFSEEGTVTITSSTSTSVKGSFNITFYSFDTDETVTFRGNFTARAEGSGSTPVANGTFSASFTGALSGTVTGPAYFGSESGGGFALILYNSTGTRAIQIAGSSGGRPGVGTHPVGDGFDTNFYATVVFNNDVENGFESVSGTMTITGSTSSLLSGSFNINLENFDGATARMTGSFKATCPSTSCN
jgi:hypothetical protein